MITFRDLKFKKRDMGGVGATHTFDNGITISVQAGSGPYSTPREDLTSSDDFVSFELAMWNEEGEWITSNFIGEDSVIGWQDRGEINALMLLIQNTKA